MVGICVQEFGYSFKSLPPYSKYPLFKGIFWENLVLHGKYLLF